MERGVRGHDLRELRRWQRRQIQERGQPERERQNEALPGGSCPWTLPTGRCRGVNTLLQRETRSLGSRRRQCPQSPKEA